MYDYVSEKVRNIAKRTNLLHLNYDLTLYRLHSCVNNFISFLISKYFLWLIEYKKIKQFFKE